MTSSEVRSAIERMLGHEVKADIGMEYDHVIGFHLRPGEMLCVVKDTGEVMWEDDLPHKLAPQGSGEIYLLP